MSLLNIEIVSIEGIVFKGEAYLATIPSISGEEGIMKNHESFITKLKEGKITIFDEKQNIIKELEVEAGFAEIVDGKKLSIIID
jgi:F0F1-type ATP synthase epsilon subunit